MFIAMDRTNYRCLPRISIGFFLSSCQEYLKALPESCILAEDPWLTFWQSIIATSQEHLANMPAPMYRESPLHDVKLVFWIIVLFFIRASPCNAKEEKEETSKDAINRRTNAFCTLSNNYIGEEPSIQNFIAFHQCYASWLHILQTPGIILKMHKETIMLMGMRQ